MHKLKTLEQIKSPYDTSKWYITKTNPFNTMITEEWDTYNKQEPYFEESPYYEIIPWEKLAMIENDAQTAGWKLILRTTNNTAHFPNNLGYQWYQTTQWIFGYPNKQILIILKYSESKMQNDDVKSNDFTLKVVSTVKLTSREKTLDEIELEFLDNYDYETPIFKSNIVEYYKHLKIPKNWMETNGLICGGHSSINYRYVGDLINTPFGFYKDTIDDELTRIEKQKNLVDTHFPASFWFDLIELNKDFILDSKFDDKVQITDWNNSYAYSFHQYNTEKILDWYKDYLYLKKFMKSSIKKWVKYVFGGDCGNYIDGRYFEPELLFSGVDLLNEKEIQKQVCILEYKKKIKDEWEPYIGYGKCDSLFDFEDIRLSENAENLICQFWLDFETNGICLKI